jgi:hypothetical protein
MLANKEAIATIGVKDLKVAGKFYAETLGLKRSGPEQPGTLTFATGKGPLLVYVSQFAGTNQATALTWNVGDEVESIVAGLKSRGVTFEHYDNLPDVKRDGDVHVCGKMKVAWFKDPDGNIHSLVSG